MRVRRPRPGLAASAAAMLVSLTVGALPGPPAGAHSGGRAQLYVASIRLEPQADGWDVALVVRDGDSGQREPGFAVQVAASGPAGQTVGPVGLADGDNDGRYEGTVPITDGSWTLTVEADEVPGGARAVPFKKTWPVTLQAGQPVAVAGSRPPTGGAGPRTVPLILGISAAATLSGLLTLARTRSRKKQSSAPLTHPG